MNSINKSKNEQSNFLDNLKSNFILKKIITLITINKSLVITKYNKKLQKRLNITINDYKECSKIEIELKIDDKVKGQFINIPDEEKEKYYHIYFDKSKKETKKIYLNKNAKVKMIKIIIDYNVKSLKKLFYYC